MRDARVAATPQERYIHRRFPKPRHLLVSEPSNLCTVSTRTPGNIYRGNRMNASPDCRHFALEAWERMTQGGLGFHAQRALITYVGEFVYRASQTKYVPETALAVRR